MHRIGFFFLIIFLMLGCTAVTCLIVRRRIPSDVTFWTYYKAAIRYHALVNPDRSGSTSAAMLEGRKDVIFCQNMHVVYCMLFASIWVAVSFAS